MKSLLSIAIALVITTQASSQTSNNQEDEIPEELKNAYAEMAEMASERMLGYKIKKEEFATFGPLTKVNDQPLNIDRQTIEKLKSFRLSEKFQHLPGNVPGEKDRLTSNLNQMLDLVIGGIENNPSKYWFFKTSQRAIQEAAVEDSEGRNHFFLAFEQIMDILSIESSDGLLTYYSYFYVG